MKRSLEMLVVGMVIGLLMLAAAVPAFAQGPDAENLPDHLAGLTTPGSGPSCEAQDPSTKPDEAQDNAEAFPALSDFYSDPKVCGD